MGATVARARAGDVVPGGRGRGVLERGERLTRPDRLALMVGTSGAMRVLQRADAAEVPERLWCYRPDKRRFVAGGALSEGGNLVA